MRKLISAVILYSFLVATLKLFSASIEIPSINMQNFSAQQIIDVNVIFSSEKIFTGYQFTVQYNQQVLRFIEVTKGPATDSFTIMTNAGNPGIIRIAGFHPGLSGISGRGILATLRFQIIKEGYSNLVLSSVKLSDSNGQSIPCTTLSGSIKAGQVDNKQTPQPTTPSGETRQVPAGTTSTPITSTTIGPSIEQQPRPLLPEKPRRFEIPQETRSHEPQDRQTKDISENIQPSNNVILLVLSEYGNPVPPPGITTFEKGDRVSCRVETEVLINDTEKAICIGCEGKGSAISSKNNSVSFVIDKNSKLVWKWEKIKIEPDFLIEAPSECVLDSSKNEVEIPLKAKFLSGFDKAVFLHVNKNTGFDASLTDTCLTTDKRQSFLKIKKVSKKIPAGRYCFSITAETEDKSKKSIKEIDVIVSGDVMLGEGIIDETSKLVTIPLFVYGNLKNISSFEINLSIPDDIKFIEIDAGSNKTKIFSGFSQKGKNLKISGGIFPSIDISDAKFLNIKFSFIKNIPVNSFILNECLFWDEDGRIIPTINKKK